MRELRLPDAGDRAGGARAAAVLTALAAALAPAAQATPNQAFELAVRIARLGPRPAAGRGEGRAHSILLRRFRRAGLRTEVQRFQVPGRGRSRNVIGIRDTPRRCLRVVMAHTDTTPNAPGANDNASGLGVIGALAPRIARGFLGCDTYLVATGAEERVYTGSPDHLGALALARRVRRRGGRSRLRWALSLDEVGRDRPFWLRSPVPAPRRRVEGALLAAARISRVSVSWVHDSGSGNSDHREFELLGMPAAKLGVGAGGEPCRHSPCDRAGRLDPRSLSLARRLVERALRSR